MNQVSQATIDAVVFDYGGVLCHPPATSEIDGLALTFGLPRDKFWRMYGRLRGPYDRGSIDAGEGGRQNTRSTVYGIVSEVLRGAAANEPGRRNRQQGTSYKSTANRTFFYIFHVFTSLFYLFLESIY